MLYASSIVAFLSRVQTARLQAGMAGQFLAILIDQPMEDAAVRKGWQSLVAPAMDEYWL